MSADPLSKSALRDLSVMLTPQVLHVLARSVYRIKEWGYGSVTIDFYKGDASDVHASMRMKPHTSTHVPFDNGPPPH